jgi:hypothetical protein
MINNSCSNVFRQRLTNTNMRILILLILLTVCTTSMAQHHKQYLGVRGGISSGISYKIFKDEFTAFEGILSYRSGGIQLIALIEAYKPVYLKHSDKVYFYSGMGVHLGYKGWEKNTLLGSSVFSDHRITYEKYSPVIGLDGILGFEYRFESVPLIIALDYKPFFELFGQNFFNLHISDFGFSVKYVFN